jgi:hypothetical protein
MLFYRTVSPIAAAWHRRRAFSDSDKSSVVEEAKFQKDREEFLSGTV